MRNRITLLAIVVLIGVTLSACNTQVPKPTPMINPANTPILMDEQNRYVDLEELYRNAPTNSTNQNDWGEWGNKYEAMRVKGKGRFDAISIHPQEGKLFLIATVLGKEGTIESNTTQIAFWVEDANTVFLGEEEGSFLFNDIRWIYLGDIYAFEGMVSGFSRFDMELVSSGYGDLIIIKGGLHNIRKETIAENSVGARNGAEISPTPTESNVGARNGAEISPTPTESNVGARNGVEKSPTPTPRISFNSHGPNDDVFALAIDYTAPNTLYAGTQTQGVFKSMDGGDSWESASSGLVNVKIGTLVIDPLLPTTIYAGTYGTDGTNGAAYRSVDGGEHWIEITSGMGGAYVFSLAIDPITPSTIYAGTSDGVFKSANGGEEWRMLNTGIPEPYITHLIIDPLVPTNLYAVSSGLSARGLIKSTNGGDDWFVISTDFSNTSILGLAIDPLTPTTLYAGTRGKGVFKSTDAGENWTAVNKGLANYAEVDALMVDPLNPSTLYAAMRDSDIFRSTNGGESWSALDSNLGGVFVWALALDPVNPTIIYAATEGGVFVLGK